MEQRARKKETKSKKAIEIAATFSSNWNESENQLLFVCNRFDGNDKRKIRRNSKFPTFLRQEFLSLPPWDVRFRNRVNDFVLRGRVAHAGAMSPSVNIQLFFWIVNCKVNISTIPAENIPQPFSESAHNLFVQFASGGGRLCPQARCRFEEPPNCVSQARLRRVPFEKSKKHFKRPTCERNCSNARFVPYLN